MPSPAHSRWKIFSAFQHPYRHTLTEFSYSHQALPGVTSLQGALDSMFTVLYPRTQDPVDTPADLPAAGNTIGDYRIVTDDGDGKAAGYSWRQNEGEAVASWHKTADMDWGVNTIVSQYLLKTLDHYVYRHGYDDTDANGDVLTGVLAGQSIYGGASANTNLTLLANSGDGVGANTGFVQFGDNVRPIADSTYSLGNTSYRFLKGWFDTAQFGTLVLGAGSITDTSGAISFGDEALSTSGVVSGGSFVSGTLTMASGSITDSSGAIAFGDENLSTTGSYTAGTLRLAAGSITDTSGQVSFADENILTTGIITGGQLNIDNLRFDGNTISSTNLNGSVNLIANGTGVLNLQSAVTSLGIAATGAISASVSMTSLVMNGGNLRLANNRLSSTTVNGHVELEPNGTGVIIHVGSTEPDANGTRTLGRNTRAYKDAFITDSISTGSLAISMATLVSFRDALVGINTGDAIFWDGSKFVASNPDAEIDHGELLAASLLDDDHSQYALLAGRASGQIMIGGVAASEDLTLQSTSHATRGFITSVDSLRPGSNGDKDLGAGSFSWNNLYLSGQMVGARVENFADSTARGLVTPTEGRIGWQVDTEDLYIGLGASWKNLGTDSYYNEDAVNWDGSTATVSYDVSAQVDNAKKMIWAFKSNGRDYETLTGAVITHTSDTNVTVTFGINLAAGTYTLVGR